MSGAARDDSARRRESATASAGHGHAIGGMPRQPDRKKPEDERPRTAPEPEVLVQHIQHAHGDDGRDRTASHASPRLQLNVYRGDIVSMLMRLDYSAASGHGTRHAGGSADLRHRIRHRSGPERRSARRRHGHRQERGHRFDSNRRHRPRGALRHPAAAAGRVRTACGACRLQTPHPAGRCPDRRAVDDAQYGPPGRGCRHRRRRHRQDAAGQYQQLGTELSGHVRADRTDPSERPQLHRSCVASARSQRLPASRRRLGRRARPRA